MRARIRAQCSNGFSLIEMLIALVIIMVTMLALLTATLQSMNANVENDLRNMAIRITNQTAETLLALPNTDAELTDSASHSRIANDATQTSKGFPVTVHRFRNWQKTYDISWGVITSGNIKAITITVRLKSDNAHKGKDFRHVSLIYKHASI